MLGGKWINGQFDRIFYSRVCVYTPRHGRRRHSPPTCCLGSSKVLKTLFLLITFSYDTPTTNNVDVMTIVQTNVNYARNISFFDGGKPQKRSE